MNNRLVCNSLTGDCGQCRFKLGEQVFLTDEEWTVSKFTICNDPGYPRTRILLALDIPPEVIYNGQKVLAPIACFIITWETRRALPNLKIGKILNDHPELLNGKVCGELCYKDLQILIS